MIIKKLIKKLKWKIDLISCCLNNNSYCPRCYSKLKNRYCKNCDIVFWRGSNLKIINPKYKDGI